MAKSSFTSAARNFASWWRQRGRRSAPQAFKVLCDCGHVFRGERRDGFQSLECPSCSQQVFALARNPRPELVGLKRRMELTPDEDLSPEPLAAATVAEPASPAKSRKKPAVAKSAPVAAETSSAPKPQLTLPADRRRLFTVPRLAVLGVCLLIALTLYVAWRQRQVRIYSAQLESATEEGLKLLKKPDFVPAAERLKEADRAARGLGYDTPQERLAAQLYRESQIWLLLSREPLDQFFARLDAAGEADEAVWKQRFAADFGLRTLVFDVWVTPPTAAEIKSAPEKERAPHHAEWTVIGQRVRAELSLQGFRLTDELALTEPRRLLFGATLAGVRKSEIDPAVWLVELAPESGALITVAEPLAYFGWPADESLSDLLQAQRKLLGIE